MLLNTFALNEKFSQDLTETMLTTVLAGAPIALRAPTALREDRGQLGSHVFVNSSCCCCPKAKRRWGVPSERLRLRMAPLQIDHSISDTNLNAFFVNQTTRKSLLNLAVQVHSFFNSSLPQEAFAMYCIARVLNSSSPRSWT